MPFDLRFIVPDQPGRCARLLASFAKADVNLDGICGDIRPGETWGFMHILVGDPDKATEIIEADGLEITSRHRVEIHEVENRPGAIGELMQSYADEGDNVEVVYTLTGNRVVIGTDSMREPISGVQMKDARYR